MFFFCLLIFLSFTGGDVGGFTGGGAGGVNRVHYAGTPHPQAGSGQAPPPQQGPQLRPQQHNPHNQAGGPPPPGPNNHQHILQHNHHPVIQVIFCFFFIIYCLELRNYKLHLKICQLLKKLGFSLWGWWNYHP